MLISTKQSRKDYFRKSLNYIPSAELNPKGPFNSSTSQEENYTLSHRRKII
jgi:hypothetical protein